MIYTSYFSSAAPGHRKVCISKKCPDWFTGPRRPDLAPSNPWADNWRESYLHDLQARFPEPDTLRWLLEELGREVPEPILCCYEKNPDRCHRRVLAEYVRKTLGMDIPEWGGQLSLL